MNKNRVFSGRVYGVQNNSINRGHVIEDHYVVVDVVNTDKDTTGNEKVPKENSMQAIFREGEYFEGCKTSQENLIKMAV